MRDAWGMNSLRFVMTWAAVEPRAGEYDEAYLDGVVERIRWAAQANLLVFLDMHQDVYGEGFVSGGGDGAPRWTCDEARYASFKPADQWYLNSLSAEVTGCWDHFWQSADLALHYAEAWRRVAARLAPFDNVVGFDVMNEPYWGSTPIPDFEPDVLAPFYEHIVPAVRGGAPAFVAFLEPSSIRNLGGSSRLPTFSFPNVVYAPHSYDRDAESGHGFDPSHRDAVIANLAGLAAEANGLGAALLIGEYGGMPKAPGIEAYMTAQYDGAGAAAAGTMYWSYDKSDSYGLLDPSGAEKPVLLDLIVRPYPERTAGDPIRYAFDAATKTFSFSYHADHAILAPTVLSVPDRVYPNGFLVDCRGCAFTKTRGSIAITSPPAGDPAEITIHP
jgi:endoglycosylceramidase